jgi:hypothetical protein
LDWAHAFIDIYEKLLTGGSHAAEWRLPRRDNAPNRRFWFFEVACVSAQDLQRDEQYVARLIKYPGRDGFRVLITEYPSALAPIAGTQQEPRPVEVVLEDRLYPPPESGTWIDWHSSDGEVSELEDSDTGSTSQTSEDEEEENEEEEESEEDEHEEEDFQPNRLCQASCDCLSGRENGGYAHI